MLRFEAGVNAPGYKVVLASSGAVNNRVGGDSAFTDPASAIPDITAWR
jgi:hypothetical protein